MGRVSPDLGVRLRDRTWSFGAVAGGDLLTYPGAGSPGTKWNQRGALALHSRPNEEWKIDGALSGTYAFDPVGLARVGIFLAAPGERPVGSGVVVTSALRAARRLDRDWSGALTWDSRIVYFDQIPADRVGPGKDGAASYTPGVELTRRMGRNLELGGAYKFDLFQEFGSGVLLQPDGTGVPTAARWASAHELQGVARLRWTRRWTFEATAGPAVWSPPGHGAVQVVPQASLQLLGANRRVGDCRFTFRHGVGLGITATPGLFDAIEAAGTWTPTRRWALHVDGGLWRSGDIPWGANAITGYGVNGDVSDLVGSGVRVGVGGSRFARADAASSVYDRNIVGLRVGWELRHR